MRERVQQGCARVNLGRGYKKYSNEKLMTVAKIAPADGFGDDMNS